MRAGKTAIVTGSTSGIALGIATALAGQGANIVLNGFGPADEIEKIVSDLKRQHNVGVMYWSANIADPDEIEDMVDQTRAEFGAVDILVNNAGIQHVDPIEEFPVDKWNANGTPTSGSGAHRTQRRSYQWWSWMCLTRPPQTSSI